MLKKTLFILLVMLISCKAQVKENIIYVAQWNIENLFDVIDDPEKDDSEFLPESEKFWTEGKVEVKLNNLAKVINFMNDGKGPDIISFQELENFNMLKRLAYKLKDRDYIPVHRESRDTRGIDVGLLYDRNVFDIENVYPIRIDLPKRNPTRDILFVSLRHLKTNEILNIYVNHWPSRRGGQEKSEVNRITAAQTLRSSIDSLFAKDENANIILIGDFNDEPTDFSFTRFLKAKDFDCSVKNLKKELLNLGYKKSVNKEGSYLFGGQWDMIDQIVISSALNDGKKIDYVCDSFEVLKPDFMVIEEGNRKGGALPTYMGNKYVGGFSDHFPVAAKFFIAN
ncbi:MAG: hypothetical protein N2321_08860 [Melioribacteraceae bacterium]|nr:hypothetical protein [Melioribacteraceae bacterium]